MSYTHKLKFLSNSRGEDYTRSSATTGSGEDYSSRGEDYPSASTGDKANPFILRLSSSALSLANSQRDLSLSPYRRQRNKRQSRTIGFLGFGSSVVPTCNNAPTYNLTGSILSGLTSNGVAGQFSVSLSTVLNVGYAPFVPLSPPGDINTGFVVINNGIILWQNINFFQGTARFCYKSDGSIWAVFGQGIVLAGCTVCLSPPFSSNTRRVFHHIFWNSFWNT